MLTDKKNTNTDYKMCKSKTKQFKKTKQKAYLQAHLS